MLKSFTVLLILSFTACSGIEKKSSQHPSIKTNSTETFTFRPKGSIYSVEFPSKPQITESIVPIGEKQNIGTNAEFVNYTDGSVLKAEYSASEDFKKLPEKNLRDALYKGMKNWAEFNGFNNPTFQFVDDNLGTHLSLVAYKKLKYQDKDYPYIFNVHWFVKDSHFMILNTGSPSEVYPTETVHKFIKSIKLSN